MRKYGVASHSQLPFLFVVFSWIVVNFKELHSIIPPCLQLTGMGKKSNFTVFAGFWFWTECWRCRGKESGGVAGRHEPWSFRHGSGTLTSIAQDVKRQQTLLAFALLAAHVGSYEDRHKTFCDGKGFLWRMLMNHPMGFLQIFFFAWRLFWCNVGGRQVCPLVTVFLSATFFM